MSGTTLFDQPPAPSNRTETSDAAARKVVATGKADSDRRAITVYLYDKPEGATRAEIGHALGIAGDSLRPRIVELMGGYQPYLDRGGEVCVYGKVDENGEPVKRGFLHHGASQVLVHKRWA
jgi:hypothetical protein